jgi:hypothetical protein
LWEEQRQATVEALAQHDAVLREAVESNAGVVVKTTGDGLVAPFSPAERAVAAAVAGRLGLGSSTWGPTHRQFGHLSIPAARHAQQPSAEQCG